MEKFWLKSYQEGVPAEIDVTQYPSLVHLLEESFRKYADRKAFVCMGKFMTYAEVDRLSQHMGAWLQSRGLQPGARVAIMMPNLLQYPVALAAVLRAGYTIVNVNPLYTPRELQHQMIDSGAEAILVLENFAHTLEQVIAKTSVKHVIVATMGDLLGGLKGALVNFVVRNVKKLVPAYSLPGAIGFNKMLAEGARMTIKPATLGHDDIAFLQYTGGTTGVAKGAVLLHRNVIANVLQNDAWLKPTLDKKGDNEPLQFLCALPLYHIYALTICALMGTRVGGLNVLIPNPRDIPGLIKELGKYKINIFPAVNTLYNALVNNPEFAKLDFSSYLVCNSGAMALQKALAEKWLQLTGTPIVEGYGLSETSPVCTANRCDIIELGTIGLPLPSTEVRILDDAGNEVPLGERGEISVRGPQVMAGYWKRDDETAKVMTADGFFKTGDIGIMDERGYTKVVDRKKDMIVVSGFNVYPNEVEDVVAAHPGVFEVACVGVPDQGSGEAVKLYVVRRDPALTEQELMDYCKKQLTGYKRPKHIEFRDALPKSNVGKILRRELREPTPA